MFLPQYNPYNNQYRPQTDADVAAALALSAMLWTLMVLLGIFLLCAWGTKIVLQQVINPYLKGALDREDGLIVVWSTLIWTVLGLMFAIPSVTAEPELALSLLGAGMVGGVVWGASIGAFLVVMLWLEVDEPWEPTHGFETITGLPGEHYRSAELDTHLEPEMTLSEIEAMLRDDPDLDNAIPLADPPRDNPPTPAAVPVPSPNGQPAEAIGV